MDNNNLCLAIAQAEEALTAATNNIMREFGLPCYLMELVISKLHLTVLDGKHNEINAATRTVGAAQKNEEEKSCTE